MHFVQAGMVEIQPVAYQLILNMPGMVEIQFVAYQLILNMSRMVEIQSVAYQLILKMPVRANEAGGAFRTSGHG